MKDSSSVALNTISSPHNTSSTPMASQKVTKMVVDVDLNCYDCYKKIKKVIGKIPEIRDQEYDVEKKQVKIRVISCCPHKIRDKLRYKGGASVHNIQILEPKPVDDKPKPKLKDPDQKPKDPDQKPPKAAAAANAGEVSKMVHAYPHLYPPNYPIPMVGYGPYGYGYEGGAFQPSGYGSYDYHYPLSYPMPMVGSGYEGGAFQPSGYGSCDCHYHHHYGNNRGDYYWIQENPQECSIL